MALHLTGGDLEKARKLNPYKRITKGTAVKIKVKGTELEAMIDTAGKYSYLNVDGVDYYVSAKLNAGQSYDVEDIKATPPQPKAKADSKAAPKAADKPKIEPAKAAA